QVQSSRGESTSLGEDHAETFHQRLWQSSKLFDIVDVIRDFLGNNVRNSVPIPRLNTRKQSEPETHPDTRLEQLRCSPLDESIEQVALGLATSLSRNPVLLGLRFLFLIGQFLGAFLAKK